MVNYIAHKKLKIAYTDNGKGNVIVFLHGYLESMKIWDEMVEHFQGHKRIICIDLPGHGHTACAGEVHDMEFMAECVKAVTDHLNIEKFFLVGHSMGGYAALTFAEFYLEKLEGLCLFHSHPFEDSNEKRGVRLKEVELIKEGKKELIFRVSIPNLYADDNRDKMAERIEHSLKIALGTPNQGVSAALMGMYNRKDQTGLLKKIADITYFIIGKKDNLIPYEKLENFARENNIKYTMLEESGHMGFYEEKEKVIDVISSF